MIPRFIKLPWFFVACWISLPMPALMFNTFISRNPLMGNKFQTFFMAVAVFVWISLAAMVIDLWASKKEKPEKIKWTLLLVFFYPAVAPFYWTAQILEQKRFIALTAAAFAGIGILTIAYLVSIFVG